MIHQSGNVSAAVYVDGYNNSYFNNASTCLSSFNVSGITTFQGASFHLSTLNVSGITILSNNVGIRISYPATKLHLFGSVRVNAVLKTLSTKPAASTAIING